MFPLLISPSLLIQTPDKQIQDQRPFAEQSHNHRKGWKGAAQAGRDSRQPADTSTCHQGTYSVWHETRTHDQVGDQQAVNTEEDEIAKVSWHVAQHADQRCHSRNPWIHMPE